MGENSIISGRLLFSGKLLALLLLVPAFYTASFPSQATVITLDDNGNYIVQTDKKTKTPNNNDNGNQIIGGVMVFPDRPQSPSLSESEKQAFMEMLKSAPKYNETDLTNALKLKRIEKNQKKKFIPTKKNIHSLIKQTLKNHDNLTEDIVRAVIAAESNYDPDAISPKGAQGLMQLMPATAARYGLDNALDPEQNIKAGIAELSRLMKKYDNLAYALAAYNAGENAVKKYNGIPPYDETKKYVTRIMLEVVHQQEVLLEELKAKKLP